MNLKIVYDENYEEVKDKVINSLLVNFNINVKSVNKNEDIFIIFSDEYEKISMYTKNLKKKDKVVIITKNLNCEYIMSLFDISKNIIFSSKDSSVVANKIIKIYETIKI